MYSSENIIWIKNIKRNNGESWAYDNVNCDNTFNLNWSTSKRRSAGTPNVGDIIALFQKPNIIHGQRNNKVHFTHLVSPISSTIIEDNSNPRYKWCREVRLIAMASPINAIPNPGHFNFFIPNRGLTNRIGNLVNNIDLTEAETKDEIWNLFQEHLCYSILEQAFLPENSIGIFGELEGDKIIREHIRQELTRRNSFIVQRAKVEAMKRGNGKILCDCCNFDFLKTFGNHGKGFIECHHKIHVSTGQRITTLEDLALVCSNCHRMLHRKNGQGKYFAIEELRKLILDESLQNN